MRRAFRGNLVKCEDVLYGVDLGADYCAEHEWGIDRLNKSFGINTEDVGVNKRLQTKEALQNVVFKEFTYSKVKYTVLMYYEHLCGSHWTDDLPEFKKYVRFNIGLPTKEDELFTAAWSEGSFAICTTKKNRYIIDLVFEAIRKKTLVVGFSKEAKYRNPGLLLCDADLMPEEVKKTMKLEDEAYNRLQKAAFADTNIKAILKEAGKSYYGLAADWTNGEGSEIKYFLNPREQDIYQWGWYSLQDLLDWCKDEGKILKAKK